MFSLIFRDADGIEQAFAKHVYDVSWSSTEKGGPLSLIAAIPIDVLAPKIDLVHDVSLYDGQDEIWLGRIREIPSVTQDGQAAIVVAEGYINHLADDSLQPMYVDARLARWDDREAYGIGSDTNRSKFMADKHNRLLVGLKKDHTYNLNDRKGLMYGVPSGTITRFTAKYGVDYDSTKCCAELQAYGPNGYTLLWKREVSGAGSGDIDISASTPTGGYVFSSMPPNTTHLMWRILFRATLANTGADNASHAKLTEPKVYYKSLSDYSTTTVLKDFLASHAPGISTDYSRISPGTYTLPDFCDERYVKPKALLEELNKYEGYDYGVWDRDAAGLPRLTMGPHELGKVHYITSLNQSRPNLSGDSIECQYNRVNVEYEDVRTGGKLTSTKSMTHQALDAWGIKRSPDSPIGLRATTSDAADIAGAVFLRDRARPQGKGALTIRGHVRDHLGRRIAAHRILPGTNILVHDLRPSPEALTSIRSTNVLNGINCFRIVQVDAKPYEATIQLDNEGDRLDFFLARKRMS